MSAATAARRSALSAGTFYDYPAAIYQRSLTTVPPWTPRIQLNNVKFDTPWRNYPGGDPFPLPFGRDLPKDIAWAPFSIVTAMDYDTPNMRVAQWNLSLQKQIGSDWLVSASYLGNATQTPVDDAARSTAPSSSGLVPCTLNGVQYTTCSTTANTNQRRRLLTLENPVTGQSYGYVNQIDTGGTASYNGLLLSVQRRAARGITVSGNYTWSHCISDMWQETAQSTNADQGWSDAEQPALRSRQLQHFSNRSPASFQLVERRRDTAIFKRNVTRRSVRAGVFLRSSKFFRADI